MGKRQRRVIPFPASAAITSPKPLAVKECSDKEKLFYARAVGPVIAAAQAVQQASAEVMMDWAGLKQEDGWQLNVDKMRWERRNTPA